MSDKKNIAFLSERQDYEEPGTNNYVHNQKEQTQDTSPASDFDFDFDFDFEGEFDPIRSTN